MVEVCRIKNAKTIPADAKVVALIFGQFRRRVSANSDILKEYCYCAAAIHKAAFQRMMRSKRFSNWLSYSPTSVRCPIKCDAGLYVEKTDSLTVVVLRLQLLEEILVVPEICSLEYETLAPKITGVCSEERFHKLDETRARALRPINIVCGNKKYPVTSWNMCLPVFASIVESEIPFGASRAPIVPSGYATFTLRKVLESMVAAIDASPLDKYSVSVECVSVEGVGAVKPKPVTPGIVTDPIVKPVINREKVNTVVAKPVVLEKKGEVKTIRKVANRHFVPVAIISDLK